MDENILSERRSAFAARLGENLRAQREVVFSQTPSEFAARFAPYGLSLSGEDVEAMESGSDAMPLSHWIAAFQIMQVADAIVAASKSNAALFLASARQAPGIEEEVRKAFAKRGDAA